MTTDVHPAVPSGRTPARRHPRPNDTSRLQAAQDVSQVGHEVQNRTLASADACAVAAWARTMGWSDSRPTPPLRPFQAAAAHVLRRTLRRWGFALLADATGLGKTYTACGAARGRPVVIVAPPALLPHWSAAAATVGVVQPRLVSAHAVHHADPAPAHGLVIVDEAHRFRNPATRGHAALCRLVGHADLLCVTATPVWNSRRDFVALARVALSQTAVACVAGRSWAELVATLDHDDIAFHALLDVLAVRRDTAELAHRDAITLGAFVTHAAHPAITRGDDLDLHAWLDVARYAMGDGEPAALFELVLARRLASSTEAAVATLARAARYLQQVEDAQRAGGTISRADAHALGDQLALPFWFAEAGPSFTRIDERVAALQEAARTLRAHPLAASPRLAALRACCGRRTLVFTEYRTTARALRIAMGTSAAAITGDGAEVAGGKIPTREALRRFGRDDVWALHALILTPVATEGLDIPADVVVHFDVPWSDARLAQRRGRALRLGDVRVVDEHILLPPRALDERIRALERLTRKRALATWGEAPALAAQWARRAASAPTAAPGCGADESAARERGGWCWTGSGFFHCASGIGVRGGALAGGAAACVGAEGEPNWSTLTSALLTARRALAAPTVGASAAWLLSGQGDRARRALDAEAMRANASWGALAALARGEGFPTRAVTRHHAHLSWLLPPRDG